MRDLAENLADIRRRIAAAAARRSFSSPLPGLIAVSKTFPDHAVINAALAGQRDFGESYLQEALAKIPAVEAAVEMPLCWHFIGPIQSNKTAAIASHFDWVHGVDRLKIAERLSAQRPETRPPLNVCLQVNISGEASKSGCDPVEAPELCAEIARLPRLRLRGLMAVPAPVEHPEQARPAFRALRQLFEQIRALAAVQLEDFDTLSMGMSDDFEIAIEEGATWVRIGSAIFGGRPKTALPA